MMKRAPILEILIGQGPRRSGLRAYSPLIGAQCRHFGKAIRCAAESICISADSRFARRARKSYVFALCSFCFPTDVKSR